MDSWKSKAERKIVLETRWKLFGSGILGYVLLAMIGFAVLTKPFLSFEMVKYTSLTIPLNAMILFVGAIALGSWIAKKQPCTGDILDKGLSGISLGQFIWVRYGFPLVVVVVLWGIYLLNPQINWDISFWIYPDTAYDAPVWKQFIIYQVISFESVTAWLLGYLTYVIQKSKKEYHYCAQKSV